MWFLHMGNTCEHDQITSTAYMLKTMTMTLFSPCQVSQASKSVTLLWRLASDARKVGPTLGCVIVIPRCSAFRVILRSRILRSSFLLVRVQDATGLKIQLIWSKVCLCKFWVSNVSGSTVDGHFLSFRSTIWTKGVGLGKLAIGAPLLPLFFNSETDIVNCPAIEATVGKGITIYWNDN